MSLADIAAIAGIFSSLAVAVSLVYVAQQVRQAERSQRAMMQQGRADRTMDGAFRLADPAVSKTFHKGVRSPEALTTEEMDQFLQLCRGVFLSAEDSVLQHEGGMLGNDAYGSFVAGLRGFVATSPGLCAAWRLTAHHYSLEFQRVMNDLVDNTPRVSSVDHFSRWLALLAAEAKRAPARS